MGHGKETPRQKMIGMMYLFYTALLALNVSAEVLSAFQLVDKSLRNSNANTSDVIAQKQNEFVKAMVNDSAGVAPWKTLADQVATKADATYDLIQYYKGLLVTMLEKQTPEGSDTITEGAYKELILKTANATGIAEDIAAAEKLVNDPNNAEYLKKIYPVGHYNIEDLLTKKDDNNVSGQIFVPDPSQGRIGRGDYIKGSLVDLRQFLINIVNKDTSTAPTAVAERTALIKNIVSTLNADKKQKSGNENDSVPWVSANFEHLPAAGVITLMTKMQSDVRNLEASMLTHLLGQIGKTDMKFNAIKAVVNAPSSYVLLNSPYKAEVFIAAYDSTENPEILVNGSAIPVSNGVGTFTGNSSSVGVKSWGGVIKLKNKTTGEIKEYPFKSEYEVGQASVTVSPTKMNVFYIGVPNPVEISASGIPSEKLNVSLSGGGSIARKSGGEYTVMVKTPGTVKINVSGEVLGETKTFPPKEFRVKRVPDPIAVVGNDPANKRGGIMSKSLLYAQAGVKAELENFDFDMKFVVKSFTVSATIKGFSSDYSSNSAAFTPQQKQLINSVLPGQKIYIENIKAAGPDGSVRSLGALAFKLK